MTTFYLVGNNSFSPQDFPEPEQWAKPFDAAGLRFLEFFSDYLDPLIFSEVVEKRTEFFQATMRVLNERGIMPLAIGSGRIPYTLNLLSHPYVDMRRVGMKWCRRFIDMAVAMGAKFVTGHYDIISQKDLAEDPEGALRRAIDGMVEMGEYAAEKGLECVFLEQMYQPPMKPYTIAESDQILEELNRRSPIPINIHLDLGHVNPIIPDDPNHTDKDKDPYAWLRHRYPGNDIVWVHLQQTDRTASCHWPFTPEYNARGIVDPVKVIQAAEKASSKDAYLSFEFLYPRCTPLQQIVEDFTESARVFRSAFEQLGYKNENDVFTRDG